jgi:tRNA (guanine37-N1)-methyltransferase
MFRVDVVTLFPEMFAPVIGLSVVGRAHERGLIDVRLHNILDALGPGERADDRPYGGGPGMILRAEPLGRILETILAGAAPPERRALVVTSAAGRPFAQADAQELATLDQLIVICGRYEGVDQRVIDVYGARELSLGDFVLTGGEIAAMAFVDATVRLLAGTLNEASLEIESFGPGGLEGPAYTRPASFAGVDVPAVLLSGDHAKIAAWRREESRRRTAERRPDLLPGPEPLPSRER